METLEVRNPTTLEAHNPETPEAHNPETPEAHNPETLEEHNSETPEAHNPETLEEHNSETPEERSLKTIANIDLKALEARNLKALEAREDFIKASPAIQIWSGITHLQRRLWNVLLANAYDELPTHEIHHISVAVLASKIDFGSKNQKYLRDALKALVDFSVEWNLLRKDKNEVWGTAALLASAEVAGGVCTYGFAPHLRYKLYNPRIYTRLNLSLQNRFTDKHALILWEVCYDYFDRKRDAGETPFIPLDRFRKLMGLAEKEYPAFKVLNRDVIKVALRQINALTPFYIDVEQRREGRRVGFLKFRIVRDEEIEPLRPKALSSTPTELPPIVGALVNAGVTRREATKVADKMWKVVEAEVVIEDYPDFETYVTEKIGLARRKHRLRNVGGFIIQALRKNYQDPAFQAELERRRAHERKLMLETLDEELASKKRALLRQVIRTDPELLERAAEKVQSSYVRERLDKHGSVEAAYNEGGMVAAEINSILAEDICVEMVAPIYEEYEAEKKRILK